MKTNSTKLISFKALSVRARSDHAFWRGRTIFVSGAHVSDGESIGYRQFRSPAKVRISMQVLSDDDMLECKDGGGLIDTNYDASLVGSHPEITKGEHISFVDGPVYYRDGSVEWRHFEPAPKSARSKAPDHALEE